MSKLKVSPLAPGSSVELPEIAGMQLATIAAGIKYQDRDDLLLCEFDPATAVAGVLTRSGSASAPVLWCREGLKAGKARALLVNAGNANTFTGETGAMHVRQICDAVARGLACDASEVFIASTGVIGEPLPVERVLDNLDGLQQSLSGSHWSRASRAIMTTDTFPKVASRSADIGGTRVTINGMAKGSGMIEPDMATMLAFIATDANIPGGMLQSILVGANDSSFNAITVDSDTSTSDTCLLFATAAAKNQLPTASDDPVLDNFRVVIGELMQDLAIQVVRDGEGAGKLIRIDVSGATDDDAAKRIAKCIANSPLVKTAIAGEDANWGRVVMAVGKSGEQFLQNRLSISFGGIRITGDGMRRPDYDEKDVSEHLKQQEVCIDVDLAVGNGRSTVWTCDLTHGYIEINADYRS